MGGFAIALAVYLGVNRLAPAVLSVLLAASVAMNAAGWSWGFFERVWGYDEIAHTLGTLGLTLIVVWYGYWPIGVTLSEHPWVMLLAVLSTGIALGAWWEIVEWAGFHFFTKAPMQSLNDKISDLVADSIGARLAAGFIRWGLVQKCDDR